LARAEPSPVVHYTCIPAQNFPVLPARVEAGLYRIAQEGLANARQHAQASAITLKLVVEDDWINLLIQDDGKGFDPDNVTYNTGFSPTHFGLTGMGERVRILSGSLCIFSAPGAGTYIEVSIPY